MSAHQNSNKKGRTKLSRRALDLLIELRKCESADNMQLLAGDLDGFSAKLMRLYRTTENLQSRGIIADLLAEVGYPWFKKLARKMITGDSTASHVPARDIPIEHIDISSDHGAASSNKTIQESSVPHSMFNTSDKGFNTVSKGDFLEMEPENNLYN